MMQRMQADLGLSDEQVQKMQAVWASAAQNMQPGGDVSPEERRAAFQKIREEMDAILTPEQRTKMQELRQQRGPGGPGGPGGGN